MAAEIFKLFGEKYNDALGLWEDDKFEESIPICKSILADNDCPHYIRIMTLVLLAACSDNWEEAKELCDQADALWITTKQGIPIPEDKDEQRAWVELREDIDALDEALEKDRKERLAAADLESNKAGSDTQLGDSSKANTEEGKTDIPTSTHLTAQQDHVQLDAEDTTAHENSTPIQHQVISQTEGDEIVGRATQFTLPIRTTAPTLSRSAHNALNPESGNIVQTLGKQADGSQVAEAEEERLAIFRSHLRMLKAAGDLPKSIKLILEIVNPKMAESGNGAKFERWEAIRLLDRLEEEEGEFYLMIGFGNDC